MKIYIVEDAKIIQSRIASILSFMEGCEVAGMSGNPDEAFDAIREIKPDLVLLDIRLEGGSGIDLLKKIKKDESGPVVVMLTNYGCPEYRKECEKLGAEYFFDKSGDIEKVLECISNRALQFAHIEKSVL